MCNKNPVGQILTALTLLAVRTLFKLTLYIVHCTLPICNSGLDSYTLHCFLHHFTILILFSKLPMHSYIIFSPLLIHWQYFPNYKRKCCWWCIVLCNWMPVIKWVWHLKGSLLSNIISAIPRMNKIFHSRVCFFLIKETENTIQNVISTIRIYIYILIVIGWYVIHILYPHSKCQGFAKSESLMGVILALSHYFQRM